MPSLLKQVRPSFFLPSACPLPDNRSSFDSHTLATHLFSSRRPPVLRQHNFVRNPVPFTVSSPAPVQSIPQYLNPALEKAAPPRPQAESRRTTAPNSL
ncbi:hypothetical protein HMPREF3038_02154 [Akkermansia sp. KLE1797]|nr:hypothetical protein HMPREF3038_02154 [Akkermansia sp. KLE1797]KXU53511.1 hypothetical protein HMPREF3039_02232 [Akkermansia sp. KLE1798]